MAVENTTLGIDGIVKAFYNCVRTRTHILMYIGERGFWYDGQQNGIGETDP